MHKCAMVTMICLIGFSLNAQERGRRRVRRISGDMVRENMRALEEGRVGANASTTGIQPEQLVAFICDNKGIEDAAVIKQLRVMVYGKYYVDKSAYMQLASEVTRGPLSDTPKSEIDRLVAVLMQMEGTLQQVQHNQRETIDLRREQMAGDDENDAEQRCQWRLDYCRDCTIGWGGILIGALVAVFPTYFGTQAACPVLQ